MLQVSNRNFFEKINSNPRDLKNCLAFTVDFSLEQIDNDKKITFCKKCKRIKIVINCSIKFINHKSSSKTIQALDTRLASKALDIISKYNICQRPGKIVRPGAHVFVKGREIKLII